MTALRALLRAFGFITNDEAAERAKPKRRQSEARTRAMSDYGDSIIRKATGISPTIPSDAQQEARRLRAEYASIAAPMIEATRRLPTPAARDGVPATQAVSDALRGLGYKAYEVKRLTAEPFASGSDEAAMIREALRRAQKPERPKR